MCVFQHKRDVCLGFEEARAGGCKGRNLLTCFEFGFLARAFLKIDRALASLPICSFSSILRPRLGFFFFVRKRWRADDAIPLADTHLVPVLRARLSPTLYRFALFFFFIFSLLFAIGQKLLSRSWNSTSIGLISPSLFDLLTTDILLEWHPILLILTL